MKQPYTDACKIFKGLLPRIGMAKDYAAARAGVILRHDVDVDIDQALRMATYENSVGLHSTYFILHTAPYYVNGKFFLDSLNKIQSLGHEIGFHNNLVALWLHTGSLPAVVLETELEWLCENGINIRHIVAHEEEACHQHLFLNDYAFVHADKPYGKFINFTSICGKEIPKINVNDYNLTDIGPFGTMKGKTVISDLVEGNFLDRIKTTHHELISVHPIYWEVGG